MLPNTDLKSVLQMEGSVSLKTFSAYSELHDDDAHIPDRLRAFTSAVLRDDQGVWVVLDVEKLCNTTDFVNIGRVH